jgi:hypothetical protein
MGLALFLCALPTFALALEVLNTLASLLAFVRHSVCIQL